MNQATDIEGTEGIVINKFDTYNFDRKLTQRFLK